MNDEVAAFYESLSRFLKVPVEQVLNENLSKNMELLKIVFSQQK